MVLFSDGELAYFDKGPREGEVFPRSAPDANLHLRTSSGELCSLAKTTRPSEFIVVLPERQGDGRHAKTFRMRDDDEGLRAWKRLIVEKFGSTNTLPQWEDGSTRKPEELVGCLVEVQRLVEVVQAEDAVEVQNDVWRRGVVKRFCNENKLASIKRAFGTTPHVVDFDEGGEEQVELKRDKKSGLAFRVATNPSSVQMLPHTEVSASIGRGSRHLALRWTLVQEQYMNARHEWDIQLKEQTSAEWRDVLCRPPLEDNERTASLFDLGSICEKGRGEQAEWRLTQEEECRQDASDHPGSWECIVRGLSPSTLYDVRVRSVIAHTKPRRRVVPARWSDTDSLQTSDDAPVAHPGLDLLSEGTHEDPSGWWVKQRVSSLLIDRDPKMGVDSRWFRVRQQSSDGMDVLWRCQPEQEQQQQWKCTVSLETDGVLEPDGKRTHASITASGADLCGRVRAEDGETVRVECEPVGGSKQALVHYSFMALKRKDLPQRSAPPCGRFVRIEHAFEALSVTDISVYDSAGGKVVAAEASMSSSFCSSDGRCFPASRSIDGHLGTFSCTQDLDDSRKSSWLCIDLNKSIAFGRLEILTRIDDGEATDYRVSTLAGSTISISTDRAGTKRTWEIMEEESDAKLLSYSWTGSVPTPSPRRLRGESSFYAPESTDAREYPPADFATLEKALAERASSAAMDAPWMDLDGDGVQMPFSPAQGGVRAVAFRVRKQFHSKAKPYWVELKGADGETLDLVMKTGDDLRQDVCVLGMLELFNDIWARKGVLYTASAGDRVPVAAPVYRVATCGQDKGFVEMLKDSKPVDDMEKGRSSKRGENSWKSTNDIVPSAVAAFISIYALNIRDRHQGNMVVTGGKLANIDFGWLEEGPPIDTGLFPIPKGLQYLFEYSQKWSEFHDLCWDAIVTLSSEYDAVAKRWKELVRENQLDSGFLFDEVPQRIRERVSISRAVLDERLREKSFGTWAKDFTHGFGVRMASMKKQAGRESQEPEPDPETEPELDPEPELELEPEPEPELEPEPEPRKTYEHVRDWLAAKKLEDFSEVMEEEGYIDCVDLVEAEDDEVPEILAAAAAVEDVKKPALRKFKRELAALRGKGETL